MQSFAQPPSSTGINLLWKASEDVIAPLRHFYIEYQPTNGNWQQFRRAIFGQDRSANVDGLEPNTAYRFRIKSVNDFGESRFSFDSDWIKTLESAPSEAPIEIKAIPYGSDSFKV